MGFAVGKGQKNNPNHPAAKDGQRNHPCRQDNANCNGPEEKSNVQRLFDGRTEAHDRQGTHHAQGQDHIGCNGQNDQSGDHGQSQERNPKS